MAIQQYILLPQGGIRGDADAVELLRSFPEAVSTAPSKLAKFSVGPGSEASIKIVDSMGGDGPKLVEMDTAAGESLNSNDAIPLRAVPVVMYAAPDGDGLPERQTKTTAAPTIELHCTRSDNGAAIAGARVLATFPDGSVESGRTDSSGKILVPARTSSIEQLIVVTGPDLWGACRTKISIELGHPVRVEIDPVVLPYKDAIARYYSKSTFLPATGVVVGVIDTGIGPHSDLNIASSCNTVTGEPASDSGDWKGHGTHVAGLIGASPSGVSRMRGLAPGVPIRSYRVFGNAAAGATNYAILKAMILAEQEG